MIELSLAAKIPMIGVRCDDPLHCEQVLQSIAGKVLYVEDKIPVTAWSKAGTFWTDSPKLGTTETFDLLKDKEHCLVFVNQPPNPLVLDAGLLMPPLSMVKQKIIATGGGEQLIPVVKGLSLQSIERLLSLTSARYGDLSPQHVRSMRSSMGQTIRGLSSIDTDLGYYEPMVEITAWLKTHGPYFLNLSTPQVLVPRGLLFEGPPGTGKTMAARALAKGLGIPLYRLDLGMTMNRYAGESEAQLSQNLALLDKEEPCVVLFDEVEKVFINDSDSGLTDRMLSQVLWWLQEHRSRVLSVMTTNDLSKIPPELYRPGRVDQKFTVKLLTNNEATTFARRLLVALMAPNKPNAKMIHTLQFSTISGVQGWSYAAVAATVYTAVKENNWLSLTNPQI